jgi:uncharacterized protein YdgA (DUF945 family)
VKKILVIALALGLLAVLGVAPYWFGREAERTFAARLEQATQRSGVSLTGKNFERGWLSSRAETVIRYPGLPVEFTAVHRISHGPLTLDRWLEGEIDLTPVQARIRSQISVTAKPATPDDPAKFLSQLPPLKTDTAVGLDGDGKMHLELPAFKKAAAGDIFEWRGMSGEIHFDADFKKFRSELRTPGLSFTRDPAKSPGGSVTLDNLTVHSDLAQGAGGHFLGESSAHVEKLGVGPLASLRDLRVTTAARAEADNIHLSLTYQVQGVHLANQTFGPGHLAIEIRKLDAATLQKYETEIAAIQRKTLPEEQAALMILGKTMELLGHLSKKAPEVEITRLSFKAGADEVRGKAKFVLDGSRSNIAENPLLLLTALAGEAELSLPPAMLRPLLAPLVQRDLENYRRRGLITDEQMRQLTPEKLARVVDQALPLYLARHEITRHFVPDAGRYRLTAAVRQGQLLVNNEPWRGTPVRLP